jgi:hypothetical protein
LAYHWCKRLHSVLGVGPDPPTPPIPYLHAPSDPTWWSPSQYIPSPVSIDNIISNLHCHVSTTLAGATDRLAESCQKSLREATFEAVAAVWSTGGPPFPSRPPAKEESVVSDFSEAQPNSVSLKVN